MSSLDHVSHDFMIGSDFQKKSVCTIFIIEPDSHTHKTPTYVVGLGREEEYIGAGQVCNQPVAVLTPHLIQVQVDTPPPPGRYIQVM